MKSVSDYLAARVDLSFFLSLVTSISLILEHVLLEQDYKESKPSLQAISRIDLHLTH
jgi:hypothetical protein